MLTSPVPVRAAAVVVPLLVCAGLATVRDVVPAASAVLVLVLCVVAVAATGDRLAGFVAALSGGAWFDVFLTQPYLRLVIDDPDDVQAAVLLVIIGLAVTEIALWGRRQQEQASRRAGWLDGVLTAATTVADGVSGRDDVMSVVSGSITEVLGADGCRYVPGPVHDTRVALLDHDGGVVQHGHQRDVERTGLPVDDFLAVEVRRSGLVVGHFLVHASTRVARPSREQRRVAALLADQVAALIDV